MESQYSQKPNKNDTEVNEKFEMLCKQWSIFADRRITGSVMAVQ